MSTYPHLDWLDSLTVTLSVSEPRRVRVCRIGGSLPLVGGSLDSLDARPTMVTCGTRDISRLQQIRLYRA